MTAQAALALEAISIRYGDATVVHDVSFEVREREFVTLLGPSGSGKTSLLRAIAGFVRPASGRVLLRGRVVNDVPPYARDIGMVFQNYALFPHMTVEDNVRFGLEMRKLAKGDMAERVRAALESVRLRGFEARFPHELSGGQQQRVAVARAVAIQPSVLLLDEPMSNLDARLRAEMRFELLDVLSRAQVTAVSVTHNQEEALAMSNRIVVLEDGCIRQIGSPSMVYTRPASPFVASFLGDANILRGRFVEYSAGRAVVEADFGLILHSTAAVEAQPGPITLLIRPESVRIEPATELREPNRLHGHVAQVGYMGSFVELRIDVGGRRLLARTLARRDEPTPAVGEAVDLVLAPDALTPVSEAA